MIQIYGKPNCSYCNKAKAICEMKKLEYEYKVIDVDYTEEDFNSLFPSARSFPQVIVDGETIGGYTEFKAYSKK